MSAWINGASVDRNTNKELPKVEPMTKMPSPSMQAVIAKEVQIRHDQRQRREASGFLDRFLKLFAEYSFSTARSHKRTLSVLSQRTPEQIAGDVRAFFAARPRPWRPRGQRA